MTFEFPPKHFEEKSPLQPSLAAVRVFKSDFDAALSAFDGLAIEHTVAFSQARWPKVALEPWLFEAAGQVKAGVLVLVQRLPLGLGHLAIVKWGPVLADKTGEDASAIYKSILTFLKAHYAIDRDMMLTVMANAESSADSKIFGWMLSNGFEADYALPFPARYHINVKLSDAEQRKSFAQKWRYHLNKAEKANLVFEEADVAQLPRFQKLYDAMSDRKNFPDYSAYHTLPHLMKTLPDALKPKLFFITHQGEDVAGAVVFASGRTAAYLYGATNNQALPLRAGYLLHARIISWLRDNTKAEWYDLGGTDGFQGLQQFKKGMVGTAGRILDLPPQAHFAATLRAGFAGHGAYWLRNLLLRARVTLDMLRGRFAKADQVRNDSSD